MAEIVNLRQRRKAAGRAAERAKADENAARHGRTRAEKELERARSEKADRHLDGHARDRPDD